MNKYSLMTLILLVYVGIICLLTYMFGCSSGNGKTKTKELVIKSVDSTISISDKVEEQLKRSDTSLGKIENTMHEVQTLKEQNEALIIELKSTKDSLVAAKKLLKKRTIIQKVLGLNKDTIQINMRDTAN